ncbi:MAG: vWA domain-containing protein [Clostridia bacterium]|jgi:Mg-chelatase subunit ChlD
MKRCICQVLAFMLLCMCIFPAAGMADQEDYYRIDVIVLMDSSNSMKYSDPDLLRFQAFENLTGQLEKGDRIGLFQFGRETKEVFPLSEIEGQESLAKFSKQNIPNVNLVYTDVKDALKEAYRLMQKFYDSGHLLFFIIFTDGDIQPASNYKRDKAFKDQYLKELQELAKKYQEKGWPIYAINLDKAGKEGDPKLKEISEMTGGYMENINTPEAIRQTFQDVLKSIRKKKVEEERKIQEEKREDTVEIRVTAPDPGEYTVLNKLEIRTEIAVNGKRVKAEDPEFELIEMLAVVREEKGEESRVELLDDGDVARGDMKAGDGIYSAFYAPQFEGEFSITLHGKGSYGEKAFDLQKKISALKATAAGKITLKLPGSLPLSLIRGKQPSVTLEAFVQSYRTERIEISLISPKHFIMEPESFYLLNEKNNRVQWKVGAPKDARIGGEGELVFRIVPGQEDTLLSTSDIPIPYIIRQDMTFVYLLAAVGLLLTAGVVLLLFKKWRRRRQIKRSWLKGSLFYWKDGQEGSKKRIDLGKFKTERIRLSTDPYVNADHLLITDDSLDMEIYSERGEGNSVSFFVTGGIDNILYIGDIPHKTIKLAHETTFRIKSHYFQYTNPGIIADRKAEAGMDVLRRFDL